MSNDTTLALNLNHPRTGDLSIRLTAPDGRRVTLAHRGNVAAATTFADRGGTKPLQALDGFQGVNARGIWVLEIFDLGDGAAGTLTGAALSFARPGIAAQSLWPAGALRALTVVELGNSSPQYLAAATAGRPDVIANI